jgi:hypothetical protein
MPQSYSVVERSNSIPNKLLFIHTDQDYSEWSEYLDQAVQSITTTKNTIMGVTPAQAVEYEHEGD